MAPVLEAPQQQSTRAQQRRPSPSRRPRLPDPEGLREYSVVYTSNSLNHMSAKFQRVMREVSETLKNVYAAHTVAIVPGSGTYAMEAVARQFGTGRKCLVIRNGYFSYRWSQIFEAGAIPSEEIVLKARPVEESATPSYAPCSLAEVVSTILRERPDVVFAPHVETSSGIMLPDEYIEAVSAAVHDVGGLFVLDCIASGFVWVDMKANGVDVLISAPQKSWGSSPCSGIVLLSSLARQRLESTSSTCFAVDLKKWVTVMEAYENGGHMYHTTMPTDSIRALRDMQEEVALRGFERARQEQFDLGGAVLRMLARRGLRSVAAEGFQAPGVVVVYTDDAGIKSGAKFAAQGLQIAAGVPLKVDDFTDSDEFRTFRLGLFGLDKTGGIPSTLGPLERALDALGICCGPVARL